MDDMAQPLGGFPRGGASDGERPHGAWYDIRGGGVPYGWYG